MACRRTVRSELSVVASSHSSDPAPLSQTLSLKSHQASARSNVRNAVIGLSRTSASVDFPRRLRPTSLHASRTPSRATRTRHAGCFSSRPRRCDASSTEDTGEVGGSTLARNCSITGVRSRPGTITMTIGDSTRQHRPSSLRFCTIFRLRHLDPGRSGTLCVSARSRTPSEPVSIIQPAEHSWSEGKDGTLL